MKSTRHTPWNIKAILLGLPFYYMGILAHGAFITDIEQTYQHIRDYQAEFEQHTELTTLNRNISAPGRLYLRRPRQLRVEIGGTLSRHYISNGNTVWTFAPDDTQYTQSKFSDLSTQHSALNLLSQFSSLREHFRAEETGTRELTLHPKSPAQYSNLVCTFDRKNLLKKLTITQAHGGTTRYSFSNTRTNTNLPPTLFEFIPPPSWNQTK